MDETECVDTTDTYTLTDVERAKLQMLMDERRGVLAELGVLDRLLSRQVELIKKERKLPKEYVYLSDDCRELTAVNTK